MLLLIYLMQVYFIRDFVFRVIPPRVTGLLPPSNHFHNDREGLHRNEILKVNSYRAVSSRFSHELCNIKEETIINIFHLFLVQI